MIPTLPRDPHPPGWYIDPDNALRHRWWTGDTWIEEAEALAESSPVTDDAHHSDGDGPRDGGHGPPA